MSLTKGYRHYCNSTWPVELISEESLILTSFVKSLHRFAMRTRSISIEDFMKNKPNISNLKSFNHTGIKKTCFALRRIIYRKSRVQCYLINSSVKWRCYWNYDCSNGFHLSRWGKFHFKQNNLCVCCIPPPDFGSGESINSFDYLYDPKKMTTACLSVHMIKGRCPYFWSLLLKGS